MGANNQQPSQRLCAVLNRYLLLNQGMHTPTWTRLVQNLKKQKIKHRTDSAAAVYIKTDTTNANKINA
ncbi:hypothetical protein BDV06DRAFT_190348, partial [Aspergillus oleicola]